MRFSRVFLRASAANLLSTGSPVPMTFERSWVQANSGSFSWRCVTSDSSFASLTLERYLRLPWGRKANSDRQFLSDLTVFHQELKAFADLRGHNVV